MSGTTLELLVVLIDQHHYGLPVHAVSRVIHSVETTPLPDAPEGILGVFNIQSTVVPLLSMRQRMGLSPRPIGLNDRFVIVSVNDRTLALHVDDAVAVISKPASDLVSMNKSTLHLGHSQGALQSDTGLVLLYDLGSALSGQDWSTLGAAIARRDHG